jgi:hypothetical protein
MKMKASQTLVGILIGVALTTAIFLTLSSLTDQTLQVGLQQAEAGGLVNPKTFKLPASFMKLSPNKITVFINGKMVQPTSSTNSKGTSTFYYSGNGITINASGTFTP